MIKKSLRGISVALVLCMLFCDIVPFARAEGEAAQPSTYVPTFQNTYVNTGNQMEDLFGVAQTQLGYEEGNNNDTKYGTWYGMPYSSWCCLFVVWCARQAEIPTSIIPQTASISDIRSKRPYYSGAEYTPKPGDLFMSINKGHIGIVWKVEGDYVYTLEGNTNPDESARGYGVMSNKRLIEKFLFIPMSYEGGGDHNFVRKYEDAHPHNVYYECTDCAERNYTGGTEILEDCRSCLNGYSHAKAGYYICSSPDKMTYLRSSPSYGDNDVGGIPGGSVVYVYGIRNSWGYVEHESLRGYVHMSNLTKYIPKPEAPCLQPVEEEYRVTDTVHFAWDAVENNERFRLQILRNGQADYDLDLGTATSYTLEHPQEGQYEARLYATNKTGSSVADVKNFTVRNIFYVQFDPSGGEATPETQIKQFGEGLTLPEQIPTKDGYTFLGWSTEENGIHGAYEPGGLLEIDEDLTMHAVWRQSTATAQSLRIEQQPKQTLFVLGDELNTTGLSLRVDYSDGTSRITTKGFETAGYDPVQLGKQTVTVSLEGLQVTYDTEVVSYIPGDVNEDRNVTEDDAIWLLRHVLFPELYPIAIPGEFTGDGEITEDDAIWLLRHVLFPELYPLN